MQMDNSAATLALEDGIARLRARPVAGAGKRRVSNKTISPKGNPFDKRRLTFATATVLAALFSASPGHAQSATFAGLEGVWSGSGTVTLDDGSTEAIRCKASYAVGANGAGLNQTLTCASDGYKFDLKSNVMAEHGALSGTWSESSRGINGNIEGHGSNGNFQVIANAPGFAANISLATRGNKQSVTISAQSQFKGASITLTRT